MKFVRLPAPGTILSGEAMLHLIKKYSGDQLASFADIGCGGGHYSRLVIDRTGAFGHLYEPGGVPFSICRQNLQEYEKNGQCALHNTGLSREPAKQFEALICWHVIEHIENDVEFAAMLYQTTAPGGVLYIAVPSRDDYWGIEDETTGHFRRYSRTSLRALLETSGYRVPEIISSNVPLSNWLLSLSNRLIEKQERSKVGTSKSLQTTSSGVREIKWKTTYPAVFKLVLNRYTLFPFHLLQKLFFDTDLGTMIIAVAQKESSPKSLPE